MRSSRGFTLVEMLVVVGLMALFMTIAMPIVGSMISFGQKVSTSGRLSTIKTVLVSMYEQHAMLIDTQISGAGAICLNTSCNQAIVSGANSATAPSATPAVTALGATTAAGLNAIALQQGVSIEKLEIDGHQKYFHWFVSNPLTSTYGGPSGYRLHYHVIAVVSSGGKNKLSPGTKFDPSTGQLTLGGGDSGVVVSGLPIQRGLIKQTLESMKSLANAYGQFFTSRYLSSSDRNPSIDYFAQYDQGNPTNSLLYDNTSPVCNSGAGNCGWSYTGAPYPGDYGTDITNASYMFTDCQPADKLGGFITALGLSPDAVNTAWGYPMDVCNGSSGPGLNGVTVRSPSNGNTTMQTPPYTAIIAAWAPGGVPIMIPVVGAY